MYIGPRRVKKHLMWRLHMSSLPRQNVTELRNSEMVSLHKGDGFPEKSWAPNPCWSALWCGFLFRCRSDPIVSDLDKSFIFLVCSLMWGMRCTRGRSFGAHHWILRMSAVLSLIMSQIHNTDLIRWTHMCIVSNSENKSLSQILLIELTVKDDKGDCGTETCSFYIYTCAMYHLKLGHHIHFDEAKYVCF